MPSNSRNKNDILLCSERDPPDRSEKSGSSLEEVVNQRLVSLEYGLSMRLSKPVAPREGGIAGCTGRAEEGGGRGERSERDTERRTEGTREGERRDAEEGENGFTRQSLSGRPRENHNARPPSSRRPSSSFCPPVRSSVCLPVHPFVSSSASCHSPRQPSDGSRIRNSSPLLSSSGFSFCSFPAAAAAGLLLCTVLLPGRC